MLNVSKRMTTVQRTGSLLCSSVLATGALAAQSTASLTGVVTDTSGRPARGALVAIVGTPHQTQADSNGRFRLEHLPTGLIKVRGMMIGYSPAELDSVPLAAGQARSVDLQLGSPQVEEPCTMRILTPPSR